MDSWVLHAKSITFLLFCLAQAFGLEMSRFEFLQLLKEQAVYVLRKTIYSRLVVENIPRRFRLSKLEFLDPCTLLESLVLGLVA